MNPFSRNFLLLVIVPFSLMLAILSLYLYKLLSYPDEYIVDYNLSSKIEIHRSTSGAVSIESENDLDTFFAIGFAHAQDRLWQLEFQRRLANGTLSEVMGRNFLSQDIWIRTLGISTSSNNAWFSLSSEAQDALQAYSDGINAYLATESALPPEFILLDISPQEWEPTDSLAIVKLLSLNLSGTMWNEVVNTTASYLLDEHYLRDIIPAYPKKSPVVVSSLETPNSLQKLLETRKNLQRVGVGEKYAGSNAWVIANERTIGNGPILANDPHLSLQVPAPFYYAHLKGDALNVKGMTLVGLPVVIFGMNNSIAWGATNMMADTQDLFYERINTKKGGEYKRDISWKKFSNRVERINVRADFPSALRSEYLPVEINVKSTDIGPIVSDSTNLIGTPASLKWTALEPHDTSFESFYKLNYATDWHDFRGALKKLVSPSLNFLYADFNNNIGYQAAGKIPLRKGKLKGQFPADGWDISNHWVGYIPFEELPYSFNPKKGYIISANNKIVDDSYPYFISYDWAPPYRALRIEQLISQSPISISDTISHQSDTVDISAEKLLGVFLNFETIDKRQISALNQLKDWDMNMSKNSTAATIFYSWSRHLKRVILEKNLKHSWHIPVEKNVFDYLRDEITNDQLVKIISDKSNRWCDTSSVNCEIELSISLNHTLDELTKLSGRNPENWKWGDVHKAVYTHTPFSNANFLADFFEIEIPSSGSPNTINAANANFVETEGYLQTSGTSFKQILQLNQGAHEYIYTNSTGQSGVVFSRNYASHNRKSESMIPEYLNSADVKSNTVTVISSSKVN